MKAYNDMTRDEKDAEMNNGKHVRCCGYHPPETRCGATVPPEPDWGQRNRRKEALVCTLGPDHDKERGHYDAVFATGFYTR